MSRRVLTLLVLFALCVSAQAEDLLMARSRQSFPEAMLTLQESIRNHGYVVQRVQRVDIGLTAMGYETDKYRVVFLSKLDETRSLAVQHPELIPYLPLKISIFAEGNQTLLVTSNPVALKGLYPDPELGMQFERWERDLRSIFEDVRFVE